MNLHCELSSKKLIILHIFINIHSNFAQDSKTSNTTHLPTTIKDSNVTWIKITTLNLVPTTSIPINYTSIENISIEDPNSDISGTARRKRRKRRRNKYRSWNQRRTPENSHKKHSTRVHLDKPVQFLIPPDYQENIISRETDVIKSKNSHENYNTVATPYKDKNIVPPARFLLPPYVDQYFLGNSVTGLDNKKTKNTEWTSNANRGSTKFKHTIYYSDSGNEILSHYNKISSTTPADVHTTEKRVFIQQRPDLSRVKPEYRPIVVQPTPLQYTTQAFINNSNYVTPNHKEKYMNSFVSNEVANAGMQVINMSAYQQSLQLLQQNQFLPVQKHKQYTETPILQQTSPRINYQQFQQIQSPVSNSALTYSNSQAEHLRYTQTYNHHYSQQNYQPTTVYSRPPDIRSTTPAVEFSTNRTTTAKVQTTTDDFKGLEIAESKYFSDIPPEQEFTALQNDQVIPGIAGRDYPVFGQTLLQKKRFACRGLEGYFADVNSRCQVFYICNGDGAGEPMLCPNGTLFSQELLVCDWWYNVDC